MKYPCDLHIHTCLSPCADDDMTPENIAGMCALKGLRVIAAADHNSVRNTAALIHAASEYGILCVPAMELTVSEEIHVLCYFSGLQGAMDFEAYLEQATPFYENDSSVFGRQQVYDPGDVFLYEHERLLAYAQSVSYDNIFTKIKEFGGIAVPAHADRPSYSVLSVFGMFPEETMSLNTIEVSRNISLDAFYSKYPWTETKILMTSSDAHSLGMISEAADAFIMELPELSVRAVLEFIS